MNAAELAHRLPAPDVLARRSLAIAALDAVLSPDWEDRCFSYDPEWSGDEELASMRDVSGNEYFVVFGPGGTVVRAFDHESGLSPWGRDDGSVAPGVLDGFPDQLRPVLDEPAFGTEDGPPVEVTFCAWWVGEGPWRVGPIADDGGAEALLEIVLGDLPDAYLTYARAYLEVELDAAVVEHVLAFGPVDGAWIERLNPEADAEDVLDDLAAMGYPIDGDPG